MYKGVCTEIAEFQTLPEIQDEEFVKIVEFLEENFHSKQKGFIGTELVKADGSGQWVMIQHWESVEAAREASKMLMKDLSSEQFKMSLDPKTVKLRYLDCVKTWGKSIYCG